MEANPSNRNSESPTPNHKDHLNKTFLEELGYKLWVTKGARLTPTSVCASGHLYLVAHWLFSHPIS